MLSGTLGSFFCRADIIDPGSVDTLLASTDSVGVGNSPTTEQNWVNEYLIGEQLSEACYYLKYEGDGSTEENAVVQGWTQVGSTDTWHSEFTGLDQTPDYFLIKTGQIGNERHPENGSYPYLPERYFLFENTGNLSMAFIDLSDMLGVDDAFPYNELNYFGKFSHIALFKDCPPVPEPTSLSLMLIGMFGLSRFRKNRRG